MILNFFIYQKHSKGKFMLNNVLTNKSSYMRPKQSECQIMRGYWSNSKMTQNENEENWQKNGEKNMDVF